METATLKRTSLTLSKKEKRKIGKREIRDSVFTNLFSRQEYLKKLYLELNPSDTDVEEEDIELATVRNILVNGMHNDLAFIVRKKDVHLVEAQSTVCPNIPFRLNDYYMETLRRSVPKYNRRQYGSTPMKDILIPHFYVVYAGEKKVPEYYDSRFFFHSGRNLSIRVKVFTNQNTGNILKQYLMFCSTYAANMRKLGQTDDAILETIEYCIGNNILKDFLLDNRAEVSEIMRQVNPQEQIYDEMVEEIDELSKTVKRQAAEAKRQTAEAQKHAKENKRLSNENKRLHQIIRKAGLSV